MSGCTASSRRKARRRARSSTPSSRRAWSRSARGAWRASPRTSRRCWTTAIIAAASTRRSPTAPTRLSRMRWRLMVRERLTGARPPAAAAKIVELWRDFIEERAGDDLDALLKNIENQRDFARGDPRTPVVPRHGRRRAPSIPRRTRTTKTATATRRSSRARANPSRNRRATGPKWRSARTPPTRWRRARARHADGPSGEMPDEADEPNSENAAESWRPPSAPTSNARPRLQGLQHEVRRGDRRRGSLRRRRARPAFAPISTSSSRISRASSGGSRTACSAD